MVTLSGATRLCVGSDDGCKVCNRNLQSFHMHSMLPVSIHAGRFPQGAGRELRLC